MLVRSHFGLARVGLGQVTPSPEEEALLPNIENTVTALAQVEAALRAQFARLSPDIATLAAANQSIPPELVAEMQAYNAAVQSYMEAAAVYIASRAEVAPDELPDPNSQAIAIPTFDLPTNNLAGFAAAAVPAGAVRIRHGFVGKEAVTPILDFARAGLNGYEGLGQAYGLGAGANPTFKIIAILLGLAIVATAVVLAIRALRQTDTVVANQALAAQSADRVAEIRSDLDAYVSTRDSCLQGAKSVPERATCIRLAGEAIKILKSGRPQPQQAFSGTGVLAVLGVVTVLGLLGAAGYMIYRRRKHGAASAAADHAGYDAGYDTGDGDDDSDAVLPPPSRRLPAARRTAN